VPLEQGTGWFIAGNGATAPGGESMVWLMPAKGTYVPGDALRQLLWEVLGWYVPRAASECVRVGTGTRS